MGCWHFLILASRPRCPRSLTSGTHPDQAAEVPSVGGATGAENGRRLRVSGSSLTCPGTDYSLHPEEGAEWKEETPRQIGNQGAMGNTHGLSSLW